MADRVDVEVRIYMTGRPGGQLEWQVTSVEADGQVGWVDGGISAWRPGTAVLPSLLGRAASLALRQQARVCRELSGVDAVSG